MNDIRSDEEVLSSLDFDPQEEHACEFGTLGQRTNNGPTVANMPCDDPAAFMVKAVCPSGHKLNTVMCPEHTKTLREFTAVGQYTCFKKHGWRKRPAKLRITSIEKV